ncbi:MAG: hypothetical protein ACI35T_04930, partial [Alistipes sp.]
VTLPACITSIGKQTFFKCSSLTSIYCRPTTPPSLGNNALISTATIYVPTESVNTYKTASGWSKYASKIVGYDF